MLPFILMTLLLCEGHAYDYGTEFVTAFPENLAYYFPGTLFLNLKITTFLPSTTVNVSMNGQPINQTTIPTAQVFMIRVLNAEVNDFGVFGKAIRITSDKNISVVSINKRGSSIQTNVVYPTTNLGLEYLVPSPNYTALAVLLNTYNTSVVTRSPIVPISFGYRLIIINAENVNNTVTVTNQRAAVEPITLGPFQLIQLQCSDFCGKVKSTAKVAVILTNPCMDTKNCRCNLVAHHVRPTTFLETKFLFPIVNITEQRLFVTSSDAVDLKFGSTTSHVQQGSIDMISYSPDTGSTQLEASQPSLLTVIQPGLIINLIPNSMFSGCYLVHSTLPVSNAKALVIVKTASKDDVHMNNDPVSGVTWNNFTDVEYSWATVDLNNCKSCIIWHPTSKIAVYVFETTSDTQVMFGGPAISINDEPDPNGCVLIPNEYELSNITMTWQASRQYCITKGMVLASPNFEYTQKKMIATLNNIKAEGVAWLGLRRSLITSEWYWHGNVTFDYANWEHDQPMSNLCVSMRMEPNGNFTWSTVRCCSPMLPLCAREMTVLYDVTAPYTGLI